MEIDMLSNLKVLVPFLEPPTNRLSKRQIFCLRSLTVVGVLVLMGLGMTYATESLRKTTASEGAAAVKVDHESRRSAVEAQLAEVRKFMLKTCPREIDDFDRFAVLLMDHWDRRTAALAREDIRGADGIAADYRRLFDNFRDRLSNTRNPNLEFLRELVRKLSIDELSIDKFIRQLMTRDE